MRTLVLSTLVFLTPALGSAQETLQVSFETDAGTPTVDEMDFRPQTLVVVWLARDSDGAHVATLARWGTSFAHNLTDWSAASGFGTDGVNQDNTSPVDGLTEATVRCYTGMTFELNPGDGDGCGYDDAGCQICLGMGNCHACSTADVPTYLDTGAVDISGVPNGNYTIEIELSYWELPTTQNDRASIPFNKNGTTSSPTGTNTTTLSNIAASYSGTAGDAKPGVYAGPDVWIDSPAGVASTNLQGAVWDDSGTATAAWAAIDPPPSSCIVFTAPDAATTDVSFCQDGIYLLGLTASDGSLTTRDELIVYVNATLLTLVADTQVDSNDADVNSGTDRFMWSNNHSRVYLRFDRTAVTGTITAARLRLHGVESVFTDSDRIVRLIENDTWGEYTITWGNQPFDGDYGNNSVLGGSFLPEFGLNHVDLDTAALQHAWFTDNFVSLIIGEEVSSDPEWTGIASKESNFAAPELIVVEAWVENNTAPTASATIPATAFADAAGQATVALVSTSTDTEDNIIVWEWNEVGGSSNPIATGESTSVDLGLGSHDIQLYVEDSLGLNDTTAGDSVLVDDRFAAAPANSGAATAEPVTPGTETNLYAHDATGDWFVVTLSADGGLDVDIAFTHADGDLNLRVLETNGTILVDESVSATDDEGLSLTGLLDGDYTIHVPAASGAAVYALTVAVTGAPELRVSFSQTEVVESAGTVTDVGTVSLYLDGNLFNATSDLSVTLSSDDSDLGPESPITILTGQNSVTFDVTITDDSTEESNEVVTVTASAPAHTAGSDTITIRDDDGPLPLVSWSTDAQTVNETDATVTVTVTMTAVSSTDVIVPFGTSGTATGGGVDYQIGATEITIDSGDTTGSLTFPLFDDSAVEGNETVILTLGTPTGATTVTPTVTMVTIVDDESVVADGGPTADGAGDSATSGDGTNGDTTSALPNNVVLNSSGCACDQRGTPIGAMFLVVALAWRRRASRSR